MALRFASAAALFLSAQATDITLVTFDKKEGTTFTFKELNDPVMGGKSTGTWSVNSTVGVFDGEVVDVPSLKGPGFIKAAADGEFADVSANVGGNIVLEVRTSTPEYKGFHFALYAGSLSAAYSCAGGSSLPFSTGCFKSEAFNVPASKNNEFVEVVLPVSSFSDHWSPGSGAQTTTCAKDKSVCLTADTLKKIKRVEIWAEGADGKMHLEIKSIKATAASAAALTASTSAILRPSTGNDLCTGPVSSALRFNISTRTTAETLRDYVEGENLTLAEAVCCDKRTLPFAEPRFTYLAPDISLFSHINETSGVTTFYDSVCGKPVFRAPVGRTFAEFQADTTEHGWPSFRPEEIVAKNIRTNTTGAGYVVSTCGTHLGSYLPDEKGPRWCIDLSCIAHPAPE